MSLKNKSNKQFNSLEEFLSFVYICLLAIAFRVLIFEPFYIPSGSMKPNLTEGDYIVSTKYSYGYSNYSLPFSPNLFEGRILDSLPERGDVIIFRPPNNMEQRYIKRLIGIPGDKIQLIEGVVYINDVPVKRNFIKESQVDGLDFIEYEEILPSGKKFVTKNIKTTPGSYEEKKQIIINNMGPFIVPDAHYFFLGDNRDQSGDSRFELGYVPFQNFIGKAQFIFFSFGEKLWIDSGVSDQLFQIQKWLLSFKGHRAFKRLH